MSFGQVAWCDPQELKAMPYRIERVEDDGRRITLAWYADLEHATRARAEVYEGSFLVLTHPFEWLENLLGPSLGDA